MQLSPAQRHSARIEAERLLRQQQSLDTETSLHIQIVALEKDVAAAAAIESRAERMEFKRDVLLPRWMPTAQSWLEGDSVQQNPVFAWCVVWLFDTGQFDQALDWADVAIQRGQETPAAFGSTFPVFVADTVLSWAEAEAVQGHDVEPYFGRTLENVTQHWNVYEVIKAKYLLIKHWDDVKAAVMNTAAFTAVAGVVEWLAGVFSAAWQWITDGWNSFIALLTGFSPSQALSGMASGIVSLFDNVWQTIKGGFLKSWNWIVGKLNKIPGVDISLANESQPALTTNTLSTGGELKGVDKGGISKTISSNSKSVTDNSRKIGEVHFHTKEALSPSQLMEWQELNA